MSPSPDTLRDTASAQPLEATPLSVSLPLVSVLMPVFNTAPYLRDAIQSIQRQTCGDFELVVIDDGSSDGCVALLTEMAAAEPRMRVVLRENRGLIATRNELLHLARSDLVAWMDSDDLSSPDRLQLQTAAFLADDRLVCLGGAAQRIDPDGHPLDVERYPTLHDDIMAGQLTGGAIRFPSTTMRRDVALKVGGFREPFRIGEDLDLLLRLSEVGKMGNLPETVYSYRQHASSTFVGLSPQWLNYRNAILELAKERRELGTDRLQRGETVTVDSTSTFTLAGNVAGVYAEWAGFALQNGSFDRARKYATVALRTKPFSPRFWGLYIATVFRAWQSRHL